MKRSNKLLILLTVLLAACVATVGLSKYEQKKEQIKLADTVVLSISPDSVTALSWDNGTDSLSFYKDEVWLWEDDDQFPVSEEKVSARLSLFQEFGASFIIENVEDWEQYGLDNPGCTICLTETDEAGVKTEYEIKVGNFSNMDNLRYVSFGDGNVYLASQDPMSLFDASLSDMIDHDQTRYFDTVDRICFTGAENYTIFQQEEGTNPWCPDDIYYAQISGENRQLDTDQVNTWLDRIGNLSLLNYVDYHVTEEALAEYGMDNPELTVTIDYSEENKDDVNTFVLHLSRNQEALRAAQEATEENGTEPEAVSTYARIGDSQIVYEINADKFNSLLSVSYDDLRHSELVTADFTHICQADITLDGRDYCLTAKPSEESKNTLLWYYQDQELAITPLRSAIKALEINTFAQEQPTEKREIALTLHLNQDDDPQIALEFYRYNGTECIAVADGQVIGTVKRSLVVSVVEAVNEIVLG